MSYTRVEAIQIVNQWLLSRDTMDINALIENCQLDQDVNELKIQSITRDFLKLRNDLKNEYDKMMTELNDIAPELTKKLDKMSWKQVMDDPYLAELNLDGDD